MAGDFRLVQRILTFWFLRYCGLVCQIHNLSGSFTMFSWGTKPIKNNGSKKRVFAVSRLKYSFPLGQTTPWRLMKTLAISLWNMYFDQGWICGKFQQRYWPILIWVFREIRMEGVYHCPFNWSFPIFVCNYDAMKVNGNGNLTNWSD